MSVAATLRILAHRDQTIAFDPVRLSTDLPLSFSGRAG